MIIREVRIDGNVLKVGGEPVAVFLPSRNRWCPTPGITLSWRHGESRSLLDIFDESDELLASVDAITLACSLMSLPEVIFRALNNTVVDIGQLSAREKRVLNRFTNSGILIKGKGGPFPNLKTVWARPGFDIAADRQRSLDELRRAAQLDERRVK